MSHPASQAPASVASNNTLDPELLDRELLDRGVTDLWLIVPVKPFGEGKSRLAARLSPTERAGISRQMLAHLLAEAQASGVLDGTLVVSRDDRVLALAEESGAVPLVETGAGINRALDQAAEAVRARGAGAILVLPADLPLITREDIRMLAHNLAQVLSFSPLSPGAEMGGICLVASPDGGTNGLAMRPIGAIPFTFGLNSFPRHRDLADAAGLPCRIVTSPTLAVDLDQPGDLWALDLNGETPTHRPDPHSPIPGPNSLTPDP